MLAEVGQQYSTLGQPLCQPDAVALVEELDRFVPPLIGLAHPPPAYPAR
jgi:hypothetical protein